MKTKNKLKTDLEVQITASENRLKVVKHDVAIRKILIKLLENDIFFLKSLLPKNKSAE